MRHDTGDTDQSTAKDLLAQARAAGLPFGVCGGRLWVHISGEHLHLLHLANRLLVLEDAVLAALAVPSPQATAHNGPLFAEDELRRLRRLRTRYRRAQPDEDRPATD